MIVKIVPNDKGEIIKDSEVVGNVVAVSKNNGSKTLP